MLWTISDLKGYKSIFKKDGINRVGNGKVIVEATSKGSGTGFFTLGTRLAFVKLK